MNDAPSGMNDVPSRRSLLAGLPAAGGVFGLASLAAAQAGQGGMQGMPPALPKKLRDVFAGMYDGDRFALPALPYAYDALEPHIDEQTMRLHHDKHHQGYVDGLNKTVADMPGAAGEAAKLGGLDRNLSFNYGGHALHSIFWATMGPGEDGTMGGEPAGPLAEALRRDFGGYDGFVNLWTAVAGTVKGSGWTMLVFDPVSAKLHVTGVADHDLYFLPGTFPLLPLDVWEHAYYLKYQNQRTEYVKAYLNVVDWNAVGALFEMVRAPYVDGR